MHFRGVIGGWGLADFIGHILRLPPKIQGWLCDRYDKHLGV